MPMCLYQILPLVSVASLKRLVSQWTERYPDTKVDPVNQWDDIITSRRDTKSSFFFFFFFFFHRQAANLSLSDPSPPSDVSSWTRSRRSWRATRPPTA